MKAEAIDIICTGESSVNYDWSSKNKKWSVASAFNTFGKNIDLYFCMHDGEAVKHDSIGQKDYPIHDIVKKYKSSYFSCSPAYMIAYAMFIGIKEVNLIGCDMTIGSEYEFERPSVLYWIGRAEGAGVKVNTQLNKITFLYGYDSERANRVLSDIDLKIQHCYSRIENSEGDVKNQLLGRLHTLKEFKNILRT